MKGFTVFLPFSLVTLLAGVMMGAFAMFPSENMMGLAEFADVGPGFFGGELPFTIRLDETIVLDAWAVEPALRIAGGGGDRDILAAPGQKIALSHGTAVVKSVGPWSGLFPDSGGNAMAALSLDFGGGSDGNVMGIHDGEWNRVGEEMAIYFRWTSSEEEARKHLVDAPASMDSARWGAVAGRRVQWFSSFMQGEGMRLRSGESLFLLDLDMNWHDRDHAELGVRPAVLVRSTREGVIRDRWYPAEVKPTNSTVIFEYPASRKRLLILCAWDEEGVLAGAYEDGQETGNATLESGSVWQPTGSEYSLRWRRALRGALFVPPTNSPFVAAVLEYNAKEIHVRQGEALRIEDDVLRFSSGKRAEAYRISVLRPSGSKEEAVLRPGAELALRFDGESDRYTLRHENVRPGEGIGVAVSPGRSLGLIAAGVALLVIGMMGAAVSLRVRR